MTDHVVTKYLALQITTMRERVEQLTQCALENYGADDQVFVRLQLIHDQFSALEAMQRDGTVPEEYNWTQVALSEAQIEQIAAQLARKIRALTTAGETKS